MKKTKPRVKEKKIRAWAHLALTKATVLGIFLRKEDAINDCPYKGKDKCIIPVTITYNPKAK